MKRVLKHQEPGDNGSSAVGILTREELPVTEIRSRLKGRVIIPGDADYDQARTIFYGGFDRHPALIVRVADASDIQAVSRWRTKPGLSSPSVAAGTAQPGTVFPRAESCWIFRK